MKKIGITLLTLLLCTGLFIGCSNGSNDDDFTDGGDPGDEVTEITLEVTQKGTPKPGEPAGKVLYIPLNTLGNKVTKLVEGGSYKLVFSLTSSISTSSYTGGALLSTTTWEGNDFTGWFEIGNSGINAGERYDITRDFVANTDSDSATQLFLTFPVEEDFTITLHKFYIEELSPGPINWSVSANGTNGSVTTTQLTFKFVEDPSVSIAGSKIKIEEITGKASFTQTELTGNATRTLAINVETAGVLSVTIEQEGIVKGPKIVIVHKDGEESNNYPVPDKFMSITIDDGPQPISKDMLDALEELGIKATFYINGQNANNNTMKALVTRMHTDGHEVGNHSQTHKNLSDAGGNGNSAFTVEQIRNELKLTHDLIVELTGEAPKTFRAPFLGYGNNLTTVVKEAAFNYPIIGVDLDTNDWQETRTVNDIADDIIKRAKDGGIILVHDHWSANDFRSIDAIKIFVPLLRAQGYGFLTVVDLADELGVTLEAGKIYDNIKTGPRP